MGTDRVGELRSGQAAVEFAIGVFLLAFLLAALTELAPIFVRGLDMQSTARLDAGLAALQAGDESGSTSYDGASAVISSLAHPDKSPPRVATDPWKYAIHYMPEKERTFMQWRDDAVEPIRLIPGLSAKRFTVHIGFDDSMDFLNDTFMLHEEVFMPPMGGME